MNIFLFDVDGTLTHPRQAIAADFEKFFEHFCRTNIVFLISGSDMVKIEEQIPQNIIRECYGVFSCSGAEYYQKALKVYSKEHTFPSELINLCKEFVEQSAFPIRTQNHLEFRPGMLNVSAIGRAATNKQRKQYFEWDKSTMERKRFADKLNSLELGYEVSCGGEISLDIVPKGWNKSVAKKIVLEQLPDGKLKFFGDRILEGGNDLPLAIELDDGTGLHTSYPVDGYWDTWKILADYQRRNGMNLAA